MLSNDLRICSKEEETVRGSVDLDMYTFLCWQQVNHLGGYLIVLLDLKEKNVLKYNYFVVFCSLRKYLI